MKNKKKRVDIFINGKNLINILKRIEIAQLKKDDPKDLAGSYAGLPPDKIFLPSKHFLGKQLKRYDRKNKTCVLVCLCGAAGCWPMVTKITITPKTVIWSNIKQAHSSEWRYKLKFTYDRNQYESELSKKIK